LWAAPLNFLSSVVFLSSAKISYKHSSFAITTSCFENANKDDSSADIHSEFDLFHKYCRFVTDIAFQLDSQFENSLRIRKIKLFSALKTLVRKVMLLLRGSMAITTVSII